MSENILVSGGAGYIGSHTCKALARHGYQPVVLDNLSTGHREFVKWGPFIEGDIADGKLVRKIRHDYQIKAVIHFAANAYVGESMENPGKYFENNVIKSLRFIQTLVETGSIPIVFSSSCATYGLPKNIPIEESSPQKPINPYGETKLFIEKALYWYKEIHNLPYAALRYFNAAGADPDGEIGEWHEPETHLIPNILRAAKRSEPLQIFGNDFPTKDGAAVRDYIHVSDLAEAHVLAVQALMKNNKPLTLNLGTGRGYSNLEVVKTAERITGAPVTIEFMERRKGDPPELVATAIKAQDVLDWQPRYSDINTIVQTAWDWLRTRAVKN